MTVISFLASLGMAVGPPLVYLDQYASIIRKKDSSGFAMDVCCVLICANITRVFFWFGKRFELALLVQSVLMIAFQLALLYVCIKYSKSPLPTVNESNLQNNSSAADVHLLNSDSSSVLKQWKRPYNFWQWESYGTYIEFIGALIGVNTFLFLIFGWTDLYIDIIGFVALGLESTLPIPQLLSNYQRKTLSGFRMTVLAGWVLGDAFKTLYFFFQAGNSWQFKATACFQLSIDFLICAQAYLYRHNTAMDATRTSHLAIPTDDLGERPRSTEPRQSFENN